MSCLRCNVKINRDSQKINCDICGNIFHPSCVSLNEADVDFMRSEKKSWHCVSCGQKNKASKNSDDRLASPRPVSASKNIYEYENATLIKVLQEITQLKQCSVENHKKLETRFQMWEKTLERIESLATENRQLKTECRKMEKRIEFLEQQQHENSIELVGITSVANENVTDTILSVTNKGLNLAIGEHEIDYAYRRRSSNGKPSNVIYVKFCSRQVKRKIIEAKRRNKRLEAGSCGLNSSGLVYVNESLTYYRRQLFLRAKAVKQEKGYKYLWIRNARIFMRKIDGDDVVAIDDVNDLESLK